ncbi:14532_t:CDS:2, partial [Racocetra fulgida]
TSNTNTSFLENASNILSKNKQKFNETNELSQSLNKKHKYTSNKKQGDIWKYINKDTSLEQEYYRAKVLRIEKRLDNELEKKENLTL